MKRPKGFYEYVDELRPLLKKHNMRLTNSSWRDGEKISDSYTHLLQQHHPPPAGKKRGHWVTLMPFTREVGPNAGDCGRELFCYLCGYDDATKKTDDHSAHPGKRRSEISRSHKERHEQQALNG